MRSSQKEHGGDRLLKHQKKKPKKTWDYNTVQYWLWLFCPPPPQKKSLLFPVSKVLIFLDLFFFGGGGYQKRKIPRYVLVIK